MDFLDLQFVDYFQAGSTSSKCMKLLPTSDNQKNTQKVVIGDKRGILQCFESKKKQTVQLFKVDTGPAPISQIELGGALGSLQDKIFVASGSEIRGYSHKGKMFLDFNSNMTEPITNLFISGSDLLVTGLYMYNHFSDCVDQGYYLSSDKINDIMCLPLHRKEGDRLIPVLACNDKSLRILRDCQLDCEIEVAGVPQCITSYKGNDPTVENELVYGTTDGILGYLKLVESNPEYNWHIPNTREVGGVSCLSHYDITGDGVNDLLVGRDDGIVEVYSYDIAEEPVKRYSHAFSESITSVQGGVVGTLGFAEIITSTYTGWVTGLTTENQNSISAKREADLAKVNLLREEIKILQSKLLVEKEKVSQLKIDPEKGPTLLLAAKFDINDSFKLFPSDASYHLTIEAETAIIYVVLQTDVPIDLLDVDKTTAVVSKTFPESDGKENCSYMLVTYRCQSHTSRVEIKFRSIEGHYGHIQAYIIPKLHPKTAAIRSYLVHPLSLHLRSHSFDDNRSMNVLKLSGPFSIAEIHSWVCFCLPDLPDRPPAEQEAVLRFCNTFLDTQLECVYRKGEGVFKSDNISTISILKDVLTKKATAKKIALNIQYEVNEESILNTLDLLHPKMDSQYLLVKKVNLLDALQELQMHERSMEFLAPEYQAILQSAPELKEEYEKQPARLERLYGMITDLYIDKFKFKGINVKQKVPQLLEILDNYDLANLKSFFSQSAR